MNLSNAQRDAIADKMEVDWTRRADKNHPNVRHTTAEYRQLECEFFIGAAGVLQQLAPPESPLIYVPLHWLQNPLVGRLIVAPYRIKRLSHASLIERATKMMQGIIPCDDFGKKLATAYIADPKDTDFRDWVKALPEGR